MSIISKINKTFIDERGSLHECMNIGGKAPDVPSGGHLYAFSIKPLQKRGDHFHKIKKEWFMCLGGEVELLLINEKDKSTSKHNMRGMDGKLIFIPCYVRHTLINKSASEAIIISYGSIPHKNKEPDTYR